MRSYYGQACADKCYRGPKSVNVRLDALGATRVAGNLLKPVNAGKRSIDLAVYATDNSTMKSGAKARITITSGA